LRITDVDAGRAQSVAEQVGADTASDANELVRWADAIVIATATDTHADLISLGAEAGLPVFCEKPIALDLGITDRVLERVNASGIPLQIGFQRRFDPGFTAARDMLTSGQLGRLYMARLSTHDPEPPPDAYIKVSGGIFMDMLIHDFDLIRWVSGQEVVEVIAAGGTLTDNPAFEQADDVDTVVTILRLADGAMAVLSGVRHDPRGYDVRLEMHGSRDAVAAGMNAQTPLKLLDDDGTGESGHEYQSFMERFESSYRQELREFLKVAKGEIDTPCSGEDAREALRLALAAKKSLREHRPVLLEEIR
ncbi:MAG: Gfo/Idh/MocA family oxidoreductase, partial [Chloroflexi bacterium]|nr:Gfo/Idh/MocA family oxidoreductase [Chloroflexota bacterium]